jgi:xanthine/CO dehydrogenase XdhC/CoxF family maturation factor
MLIVVPTLRVGTPLDPVADAWRHAHTDAMTDAPAILIVGDGPVAQALSPMAVALGWTPTTVTGMDDVAAALDRSDAAVVLSHHEGVDGPAIRAALAAKTAYVGAMGSRRTQARRRDWLLANGVTEAELSDLHAPIGLDIGADEPGEIAVSILAEIVATRRGSTGSGSISERGGAIHPDQEPGTATCPGG